MTTKKLKSTKKEAAEIDATEQSKRLAGMSVSGVYNAAETIMMLNRHYDLDAATLCDDLKDQLNSVLDGDTRRMEIILMTQAQTLHSLFHFAVKRISKAEILPQIDTYTGLAIKANNACRKSLLALSQIKNPVKATFIKQQNNAVNQQVNNHSENSEKIFENELLPNEVTYAILDSSGTPETSDFNPSMATVETVHRG